MYSIEQAGLGINIGYRREYFSFDTGNKKSELEEIDTSSKNGNNEN